MYGKRRQKLDRSSACSSAARRTEFASMARSELHGARAVHGHASQSSIDEQRRYQRCTWHLNAQGLEFAHNDSEGCRRAGGAGLHREDATGHGRPYTRLMQLVPIHGCADLRAREAGRKCMQGDMRFPGLSISGRCGASPEGMGGQRGNVEGQKNKMTRQNLDSTCTDSGLDLSRKWTRYPFSRTDSVLDKSSQSLSSKGRSPNSADYRLASIFCTPLILPTHSGIKGRCEGVQE